MNTTTEARRVNPWHPYYDNWALEFECPNPRCPARKGQHCRITEADDNPPVREWSVGWQTHLERVSLVPNVDGPGGEPLYQRDESGRRPLIDQQSVWAVDCPNRTCGAKQGERCRDRWGNPENEHKRRVQRMNGDVVARLYTTWFESNRSRH
jgi:hypothetical protein